MLLTKAHTSAMAAQLDRVNETDSPVVRRLRTQLQERDNLIADLRAQIRTLQSATVSPSLYLERGQGGEVKFNNRPTLTPTQAAAQTGLSQSTISRYLTTGYWEGAQLPGSNRWLVYADQALSRKRTSPSLRSGEGARGWG